MKSRLTDRQKSQIARRREAPNAELIAGTVITHHGTELIIETTDGRLVRATARRTLGALTTGDLIGWRTGEEQREIIEHLHARANTLIRPDTHGKLRLMAANIDQVVIVLAPIPWMNPNIVEQAIVATLDLPAKPLIVLNKIDEFGALDAQAQAQIDAILCLWQAQDIDIIKVSAHTGEGIEALRLMLANQISMMIGLSGVGKTSLARRITSQAASAAIQALSEHSQEGQHTTRHSTLFRFDGMNGGLIDAPGVRDFAVAAQDSLAIDRAFPDILELAQSCRFNNCSHQQEPNCAVRAALAEGRLDARRFDNYQQLKRQCQSNPRH